MWVRVLLDEAGSPRLGFRQDLHEACAVCGKEHVRRTYGDSDLHAFTTARLQRIAASPVEALPFECEQCGSTTVGDEALHSVFGPASTGRVECWRSRGVEQWRVDRVALLDAQELARPLRALPDHEGWGAWPGAAGLARTLGRWWSPKERIRAAVRSGALPMLPEYLADGLVWSAGERCSERSWHLLTRDGAPVEGGAGAPAEWLDLGGLPLPPVAVGVEADRWLAWLTEATAEWPVEVEVTLADGVLTAARRDDSDDRLARWQVDDLTREAALTATAPSDVAAVAVQRALTLRLTLGAQGGAGS